jgi:hypothetical protein
MFSSSRPNTILAAKRPITHHTPYNMPRKAIIRKFPIITHGSKLFDGSSGSYICPNYQPHGPINDLDKLILIIVRREPTTSYMNTSLTKMSISNTGRHDLMVDKEEQSTED